MRTFRVRVKHAMQAGKIVQIQKMVNFDSRSACRRCRCADGLAETFVIAFTYIGVALRASHHEQVDSSSK